MIVLSVYPLCGISYTHDGAATIIRNGRILYSYEEEKATRFQHSIAAFPEKSAILGLKYAGLESNEIDHLVTVSMDSCATRSDFSSRIQFAKELLHLKDNITIDCIGHHLAHSATAVLTSSFEDCAFLTIDGGGDGIMGHWGIYAADKFDVAGEMRYSPAILYGYITSLAGFSFFEEGKVMGLSSYGRIDSALLSWLEESFSVGDDGVSLNIDENLELQWQSQLFPQLADVDAMSRHRYFKLSVQFPTIAGATASWKHLSPFDIARTGQYHFEQLVIQIMRNVLHKTQRRKIALSGGAFQNVVLNDRIRREIDATVHIPMAPHDAGLSLGAALYVSKHLNAKPHCEITPYLGPSFEHDAVEEIIKRFSLQSERTKGVCRSVAEFLVQGKVVGWFQGRAEFGARALGARSVLADPRVVGTKSRVNGALKMRDWFMPYAPSVLVEFGEQFFEDFSPSPYMNRAFRVKPNKLHLVPAAVHVDGTCRAHTVDRAKNPLYHNLIMEFYNLTGIPMILNTSFNRHGLPMVSSPRQAIQHLVEGNVDILAMGEFLVFPTFVPREVARVWPDDYYLGRDSLLFVANLLKQGMHKEAACSIRNLPVQIENDTLILGQELIWKKNESDEALTELWGKVWLAQSGITHDQKMNHA